MSYIIISTAANQDRANVLLDTNFAGTVLAGTPEDDENYASGVVVTGRKTFSATDLPTADAECSNGSSSVRMYQLEGATVFIESGDNDGLGIYPPEASLRDYFDDWDFGDVERAIGMAEFGFDDEAEVADEADQNVRVWVQPNYYAGTLGAPTAHFARDEDYDDLVFDTVADAQAWIDEKDSGIYCTAHGEAGRPAYTIVK